MADDTYARIFVTQQYEKFKFLNTNRDTALTRAHVEEIKQSMIEHPEMFASEPINVNDKFEILDGQHRYLAAMELNRPIFYTVLDGAGIEIARIKNTTQKPWGPLEFAHSYAAEGNDHYRKYLKAREDYEMPHRVTAYALSGGENKTLDRDFRRGAFMVTNETEGRDWMNKMSEVRDLLPNGVPYTSALSRALLIALKAEDFNYEVFINQFKNFGITYLRPYSNVVENLRMIEQIYNHGRPNKITLFR